MKTRHVLSCVLEPGSLPGFLSDSLQRQRGSLKTDSTDELRPAWQYRHLPAGRYISTQCLQMHTSTRTQTHACLRTTVHLCPSTPQEYLLWHVLQLHKHTHVVRLPLVICAAACGVISAKGVSPVALSTWNIWYTVWNFTLHSHWLLLFITVSNGEHVCLLSVLKSTTWISIYINHINRKCVGFSQWEWDLRVGEIYVKRELKLDGGFRW